MSILKKLLAGFSILSALVALGGYWGFHQLTDISKPLYREIPSSIDNLSRNAEYGGLAQRIRYYDEVLTQSARNFAFTQNPKWEQRYFAYEPLLEVAIQQATYQGEKKDSDIFKQIGQASIALTSMEYEVLQQVKKGKPTAAVAILESSRYEEQKSIFATGLNEYFSKLGMQHDLALESSIVTTKIAAKQAQESIQAILEQTVVFALVLFLVSIVTGVLITRSITRPIWDLIKATRSICGGDFARRVKETENGELGVLSRSFNQMIDNLVEATGQLRKSNAELDKRVAERTAALTASERRYRSILSGSPVPMALNDELQQVTFLNPAFVQTFGYTQKEIPTLAHWWAQAYPDLVYRQEVVAAWQAHLAAARLTGSAFSPLEVNVTCKDLTSKTVLVNAASIIGALAGEHLVTMYDITERKVIEALILESKENYHRVFENQMIAICIFDVETLQIIDVNDTQSRLYGYSQEELLGGMVSTDLSAEPETTVKSIQSVRSQRKFSIPIRYHKKKDGTIFPVEIRGETYLRNGRLVMLGMVQDITERLQNEKDLHHSLAEKEVLLREVHHRVKNNMAAIIGLLDLQRQAMGDAQCQAMMLDLSSRVRAMSLVHEKLYRSKSLAQIDFQDYLQALISHLRTSFGSPCIRCEIEAQGVEMPLDLAVPCGMIVNELIINALKYAFPQERDGEDNRIVVTVTHQNDCFTLTVADNGVGLPPQFDLHTTTTLGLSLVQMLGQHQLGGHYVIDRVGGTRFALTFSVEEGGKPYA